MIIIMNSTASQDDVDQVEYVIEAMGLKTQHYHGGSKVIIGIMGDKSHVDIEAMSKLSGVEAIVPIMKPYKLIRRGLKSSNYVIQVGDVAIGGNKLTIIAGPKEIDSYESLLDIAKSVKRAGASILRVGGFKPNLLQNATHGIEEADLKILQRVGAETNMKTITEVVDTQDAQLVGDYADIIQIGSKNMQNFRLLSEVARKEKPILLKRGPHATINEWLTAAEYIISAGNPNVILCEKGNHSFETAARNTLDINAVVLVKRLSHLPVIADLSHGNDLRRLVHSIASGLVAGGADGLIFEVHRDPVNHITIGTQSLCLVSFDILMKDLLALAAALDK